MITPCITKSTSCSSTHCHVGITIQNVKDPNNDPVTIKVTKVMQDEPVNGLGDGDTAPDASGIGTSPDKIRKS